MQFMRKFDEWELSLVLTALGTPHPPPLPVVCHATANLRVFCDPRVQAALAALPFDTIAELPADPPAPGWFLALLSADARLRILASGLLRRCPTRPLPPVQFSNDHAAAVRTLVQHVAATGLALGQDAVRDAAGLAQEPEVLWANFGAVLALVPDESLRAAAPEFRSAVVQHLHDTGARASLSPPRAPLRTVDRVLFSFTQT